MDWKKVVIGCMGALLVGSVATGLYMRHDDSERIKELESQLGNLRKQEEQAALDRSVSQQMEKIAYGQQALSEERSREAIRQSEIAQEMTLRSETERKKALQAQGEAEASAKEAQESYQLAERQRLVAEDQRLAAEHAKRVADTLNYISIGRNLGSQSYAVYRSGDKELGNLLAYASYLYTYNYGGDLYTSSVFQALTQAAGGRRSWSIHSSRISGMDISAADGSLLTISTYGELQKHQIRGGQMKTTSLMNDKNYCFRDVYAAKNGRSYAVSHTGHLIIVNGSQTRVVYMENANKPFSLQPMNDGNQLLIIGTNSLTLFDLTSEKVIRTRHLDFNVTSAAHLGKKPLLFDNRGRMHQVNSLDGITSSKVPVTGQVTAFAHSKTGKLRAYGMDDGTIWLVEGSGSPRKLAGHLSKVTKMNISGEGHLYSSSYDGKLLFWMTSDMQIRPITLFQSGSWLTDFTFSSEKSYIWTSEYNGTINEHLISLDKIAQRLRQNVKRNFTQQEWDYYVGKEIPYLKVKE